MDAIFYRSFLGTYVHPSRGKAYDLAATESHGRSWTNVQLLHKWKVLPARAEIAIRRVKWWQAMTEHNHAHLQTMAAILGQLPDGPQTLTSEGVPAHTANPFAVRRDCPWETVCAVPLFCICQLGSSSTPPWGFFSLCYCRGGVSNLVFARVSGSLFHFSCFADTPFGDTFNLHDWRNGKDNGAQYEYPTQPTTRHHPRLTRSSGFGFLHVRNLPVYLRCIQASTTALCPVSRFMMRVSTSRAALLGRLRTQPITCGTALSQAITSDHRPLLWASEVSPDSKDQNTSYSATSGNTIRAEMITDCSVADFIFSNSLNSEFSCIFVM